MAINIYVSIITLNANGLKGPIKILTMAKWIKNRMITLCSLQIKGHTHWKVKG